MLRAIKDVSKIDWQIISLVLMITSLKILLIDDLHFKCKQRFFFSGGTG